MGKGNANRAKGHQAERYYAKVFRKLGYTYCKTCRLTSRLLDNCKIDLAFLPFNVQVKGGAHTGLHPSSIFTTMEVLLKENYPPFEDIHRRPMLIIHRPQVYAKGHDDDIVYIPKKWLLDLQVLNPRIDTLPLPKMRKGSNKYEGVAKLTFKTFREHIVPLYKQH